MNKEFYKEDGTPLELRMYFFVPYNISPIQQAIQAGHASLEYAHKYAGTELFQKFMQHKTWIILNGGTTNDSVDYPGTLNVTSRSIDEFNNNHEDKINFTLFSEPDLNFALTAVCFICDERVFNYEDYPDFPVYMKDKIETIKWLETFKNGKWTYEEMREKFPIEMKNWINDVIGGEKNLFLRELIRNKKLA